MPHVGNGSQRRTPSGATRVAASENTSAPGSRPLVSLSRWVHPRLLDSVSQMLLYEPVHPLNVLAQHLYHTQTLLAAPITTDATASPATLTTSSSVAAVIDENPLRCFTAAFFLRTHLTPYGVEALRTAILPGWCSRAPCQCASSNAPALSLVEKQALLQRQHDAIIALLRCQDRATVAEKEFAAVSESSCRTPITPLFFSEENEVAGETVALFCAAWIEQELQLELPSAVMPTVALATILVALSQLYAVRRRQQSDQSPEPPQSSVSSLPTVAQSVCGWVCLLSRGQVEQLYAYLYCCLACPGKGGVAPRVDTQTNLRVREAVQSVVNTIQRVTALEKDTLAATVDPSSVRRLLSSWTLTLSCLVHLALPLCHWVSANAPEGTAGSDTNSEGGAVSPFLTDTLPRLATVAHTAISLARQEPSTISAAAKKMEMELALSGSMSGFSLAEPMVNLAQFAQVLSVEGGSMGQVRHGAPLPPSLLLLTSHAASVARATKRRLSCEDSWIWICLCMLAVWEDLCDERDFTVTPPPLWRE